MPDKPGTGGFRYVDLVALAIGLMVLSGLLLGPSTPGSWAVAVIWAAYAVLRLRTVRHYASWLFACFSALFAVALVVTFWPAPLMWFVVAVPAGAILVLVGVIAGPKRLGDPPGRLEIFKVVTVIGCVVLMIAFAETFLRAFPQVFSEETQSALSATPANAGMAHAYIGHLHRPSRTMVQAGRDFKAFHNMDASGFRNAMPWPNRAEIVAIGDSLTYGLNVGDEHVWPALVARTSGMQVINLGLIGASPEQYYRVYETFGARLQPKLLLVGFYAQNDFWDAGMFDLWLREGVGDNYMVWRNFGRPLRYTFSLRHPIATAEGVFRSHVYPLIRSSHLYNLMRAVRGGDVVPSGRAVSFNDGSRLQLDRAGYLAMTSGAEPDRREFQLVVDSLRKIHALATKHGTHVLVVLQPGKEEVYLPLSGDAVADPAGPLRAALGAAGMPYLDLAPVFRERAAAGERLFFEVDSHPNEAGYALIGRSVASHIAAHAREYGLAQ